MMPGLNGESLDLVERDLDAMLSNPAATLTIKAGFFFNLLPPALINRAALKAAGHQGPVLTAGRFALAPVLAPATTLAAVASTWGTSLKRSFDIRQLFTLIRSAHILRPILTLNERETALLRNQFALYRDDPDPKSVDRWARFLALFIFHDGKGLLVPDDAHAASPHLPAATDLMKSFIGTHLPTYENHLAQATQDVLVFQQRHAISNAKPAPPLLTSGAQWLTPRALESSDVFTTRPSPTSLILGRHKDSGQIVHYPHNESLVTIGGAGTGKSQAHVIPNLLTYKGSAFVLDVKGELWSTTAGYRARHFGPVYRFAPTDPQGLSHAYNPFDFISRDPALAASQCMILAHQLVGEAEGDQKYWTGRARDFLWAFAMLIALRHPNETRNLTFLTRYLALPTAFEDITTKAYKNSETAKVIAIMRDIAKTKSIPQLATTATAFENSFADNARIESILDTARQFTSAFALSPNLRAALSTSSWAPRDLRNTPGTTVYISLRPGDLAAFAPIVRILFQQHADQLIDGYAARPGEPPITFFLDEMPQLAAMPSLTNLLDLGRSAGLRLWLFAQYYGQFKKTYRDLTTGLIGGCRVTSFMKPDDDAIDFIRPALGKTTAFLSNSSAPLASDSDLRGRAFRDDIITLSPGEDPMRLEKLPAHAHFANRMTLKPPSPPKLSHP